MRPLIFLDIDGVLNRHGYNACSGVESSTIEPGAVASLNRILRESNAEIVLSSAWRYMVYGGAMSLRGFEYLLRTHGLAVKDRLVGLTVTDEEIPNRGQQIVAWLNKHGKGRPYVVLDDGGSVGPDDWSDLGIEDAALTVVWCDGEKGLTEGHADRALSALRGECQDCLGSGECSICRESPLAPHCVACGATGDCLHCKGTGRNPGSMG